MSFQSSHTLLISGNDLSACTGRALHFLESTQLIHYDHIKIIKEHSCSALSQQFQPLLARALQKNQNRLNSLVAELQAEGFTALSEMVHLPHGYHSKILHTIAHMTDGFFGIDAAFFDLDESSYQLSAQRKLEIKQQPDKCWLLTIQASSTDSGGFEQVQ